MIHQIAFAVTIALFSQMCLANPLPEPEPYGHRTHFKIHVPYDVHTVHHHHIERVPVIKTVPIIKEVPVLKEVPIIKTLPVVHTVPVPVVNTVHVEKPVFLPIKEDLHFSHWH